jgi:hypothetical protein
MAAGAAVAGHPLRWRSGLALPEALMASWRAARGLPAPFKRRGARRVPRRGGEHAGRRYPLWTLGSRPPIVLVLLREATSIAGRGKEQLSGPRGKRRTSSRGASGFRWGAAARGRWQSCEQQGGGSADRHPPPRWRNPQHALGAWKPAVRERAVLFDGGWHAQLPRGHAQESARLYSRLLLRWS